MKTPKAQATAQRIADAAAKLFEQQGFDETTIAAVAELADVAAGTVMLHFGSKSQLATAAFADQIRCVVEAARVESNSGSLHDDLAHFVGPIYRWYASNVSFAPDLLREAMFSDGPWSLHYEKTVGKTVAAFAEIVHRHQPKSDADLVAEGLLADYLLVLMRSLRSADVQAHSVEHFLRLAGTRL